MDGWMGLCGWEGASDLYVYVLCRYICMYVCMWVGMESMIPSYHFTSYHIIFYHMSIPVPHLRVYSNFPAF